MSIKDILFYDLFNLFRKKAMVETAPDATVQVVVPAVPTLAAVLEAKLNAAKGKVADLEKKAADELAAARDEVAKLEAEVAAIPEHLKALVYEDVVKKVDSWFK